MRTAIAILLFVSLTVHNAGRLGIFVYFKFNQEEITRLFCVNKNRPELACNGQCYFMKTLAEYESNKAAKEAKFLISSEINIYPPTPYLRIALPYFKVSPEHSEAYLCKPYTYFMEVDERPPIV
ncbi:hypothetical protein QWY31_07895 [Cytophagales bacterium LB-30]|uniref:Uncharacterized protein n=1 Tax=Shiella aurantiaca TaxID=3058365 RepID=A0ABT8F575_9BACT|nr:hypothetical protein [Shiella aurantiaca]MDN4165419.1 hypothetical protein [Shiella aurantiaca]